MTTPQGVTPVGRMCVIPAWSDALVTAPYQWKHELGLGYLMAGVGGLSCVGKVMQFNFKREGEKANSHRRGPSARWPKLSMMY